MLTRGGYDNRPQAATSSYISSPLSLGVFWPCVWDCPSTHLQSTPTCTPTPSICFQHTASTTRPTQAYGLAEARGDLLSGALGGWGAAELSYNPISNNLGASASGGGAHTVNALNGEELLPGSSRESGFQDRRLHAGCLAVWLAGWLTRPSIRQPLQWRPLARPACRASSSPAPRTTRRGSALRGRCSWVRRSPTPSMSPVRSTRCSAHG